jgi:hypothetical protein
VDVVVEDRGKVSVLPYGRVKFADNSVDLISRQHFVTPKQPKSGQAGRRDR